MVVVVVHLVSIVALRRRQPLLLLLLQEGQGASLRGPTQRILAGRWRRAASARRKCVEAVTKLCECVPFHNVLSFKTLGWLSAQALKGLDPKLVKMIEMEIVDNGAKVGWDDIAGQWRARGSGRPWRWRAAGACVCFRTVCRCHIRSALVEEGMGGVLSVAC